MIYALKQVWRVLFLCSMFFFPLAIIFLMIEMMVGMERSTTIAE